MSCCWEPEDAGVCHSTNVGVVSAELVDPLRGCFGRSWAGLNLGRAQRHPRPSQPESDKVCQNLSRVRPKSGSVGLNFGQSFINLFLCSANSMLVRSNKRFVCSVPSCYTEFGNTSSEHMSVPPTWIRRTRPCAQSGQFGSRSPPPRPAKFGPNPVDKRPHCIALGSNPSEPTAKGGRIQPEHRSNRTYSAELVRVGPRGEFRTRRAQFGATVGRRRTNLTRRWPTWHVGRQPGMLCLCRCSEWRPTTGAF